METYILCGLIFMVLVGGGIWLSEAMCREDEQTRSETQYTYKRQ